MPAMNPFADSIPSLHIPVLVGVNGMLTLRDGTPLPPIESATEAVLTVPEYAVQSAKQRTMLRFPVLERLLPAGTNVFAEISSESLPRLGEALRSDVLEYEHRERGVSKRRYFVPIVLHDDLCVSLSHGKRETLLACRCSVLALERVNPESQSIPTLNQAYTRISETYEPHRASHTGNVFDKVFVHDAVSEMPHFRSLKTLRAERKSAMEEELRLTNDEPQHVQDRLDLR